jgi:hypothetical protein
MVKGRNLALLRQGVTIEMEGGLERGMTSR